MAAPAYATDIVDINASAETVTSWSALGGGGAGLAADPDFAIQPTNSLTKQVSNALKGMVYEFGSTRTQATNDHIYQWIYATTPGLLNTLALGGMRVSVGTSDTALNEYYIRGAAEYAEGGWVCEPVRYDSAVTPSPGRQLGTPGSAPSSFGGQIFTTATVKAVNFGLDVSYEGSTIEITAGELADPATLTKLLTYTYDSTRRWPVMLPIDGGGALQGKVYWGTAAAACYARDSGQLITFVDTPHSLADLTEVIHANATSDQIFTAMNFLALGTFNRGKFTVLNDAAVDYSDSTFKGIDTFVAGGTGTVLDGCVFDGCNEVTGAGASFLGAQFLTPTVAADSYALLYNEAVDPDGELDGSTFSKGTASHHAIEFGTVAPTTMTLRGIDFTGFSGTTTAAALNFLRTTGATTVNLVGCTGTITAQVTGSHTVSFIIDPVTISVHVQNITTGADIASARVYLLATTVGPLPWEDTVTITRTTTTAFVAHTGHGLATNQWVKIEGAVQEEYNGGKQITVTNVNEYTYTVSGSPTSPATGTIDSTAIVIFGVTDVNGDISDLRSYSSDQGFAGWIRKSSNPYFKASPVSGTISSTDGLPITVGLIPDG